MMKVNVWQRYGSMLLDHFIMCFVSMIPVVPIIIYFAISSINSENDPEFIPGIMITGFVFAFSIYFNKDFFNGRSPAKRALGLQVINNKSGIVASPIKCLIRNLTIPIWPIEGLFILFNPSRRLGDYIAGTKVEFYDSTNPANIRTVSSYIYSILIAVAFNLLISLPFFFLMPSNKKFCIEESFNKSKSEDVSYFLSYRLRGISDSLNVKYFDKSEIDSIEYLALKIYLKEPKLLNNDISFMQLRQTILDTLNVKIDPGTYLLSAKAICNSSEGISTRSFFYNPLDKRNPTNKTSFLNDSSRLLQTYYPNGILESEATYVYGKIDGKYKEWHNNGQLKTEIEYVNGKRNGITKTWYRNGNPESEMLYQENTFIRDIHNWDENGHEIPIE